MRYAPSSSFWKGVLGGFAGVVMAVALISGVLLCITAYQDHRALQVLIQDYVQRHPQPQRPEPPSGP